MIRVTLRGKVQFNEQYWSGISDAGQSCILASSRPVASGDSVDRAEFRQLQ